MARPIDVMSPYSDMVVSAGGSSTLEFLSMQRRLLQCGNQRVGLPPRQSRDVPADDNREANRMRHSVVIALLIAAATDVAIADSTALVGVLEHVASAKNAVPGRPSVRVAFRHTVVGWEAFPNDCVSAECLATIASKYPPRATWLISLAGLKLGSLTGRTPTGFDSYAHIGRQTITSRGRVPTIGRPSLEYAGFLDEPAYRPLLATSGVQPPRRSRAGWQIAIPEPEDLDRIWPSFKRLIPVINVGDSAGDAANADTKPETVPVPRAAGRAPRKLELEIPLAWVARNGDALLKVAVRRDIFEECDGPREFPSQLWLYRDARGGVHPLAGQLDSMRVDLVSPLDFNDLLRDGHDEVLFWAAGYNRGGYVLYYDGFRKNVKYLWSYH